MSNRVVISLIIVVAVIAFLAGILAARPVALDDGYACVPPMGAIQTYEDPQYGNVCYLYLGVGISCLRVDE